MSARRSCSALIVIAVFVAIGSAACRISGSAGDDTLNPVVATGTRASSGFDTDAEGWTITGDAQADHVAPDYSGHGGNHDGLISAVDDVAGGVWYFQAPNQYLGDATATYGRYLELDVKTNAISSPFDSFDVALAGGGMILGFDARPQPIVDMWSTYRIKLDESAGWRITPEVSDSAFRDYANLPVATAAQIKAVLGSLTRLLIRGEFQTGADTGALDNVKFGAL